MALALLPLVPLWRAVFLGQAIGPFDQIRQMAPWNGPAPSQPWDVLQADGVLQFYPWRDMVFEAWSKGQIPAWNPYELAGTPLLADSQSGALYPPHILLGILHMPTQIGITLLAWFHLAWAGIGVFFLTRRLAANRIGSFIAGASFGLSAFMVGWTALASVISTVAWIPWLLACIVSLYRETWFPRDRETLRLRFKEKALTFLALGASVAMMLLAGHLQFAAYGLIAALLVALGMAFVIPNDTLTLSKHKIDPQGQSARPAKTVNLKSQRLAIGFCLFGLAIGGLLSAPQILPVLKYGKFSHRQNTPTQAGYTGYVAASIKPFELASLAVPNALGSPRTPMEGTPVSQYWPALVKTGDNFAESALSIGPLILIGLFLVPWKRRELWPMAVLGLLGLLLSLGTALNMALYFLVPGWSATGSPGRAICLFLIPACSLGGFALGEAMTGLSRLQWFKAAGALALGALLPFLGPLLAPAGSVPPDALATVQSAATANMLPTLAISTVLAAAALAMLGMPRYRPLATAIPILLCWVGYGSNLIMTGKPLDPISGVPAHDRIAFINEPWELPIAAHAIAPPNTASLSRIHELGGYDSLIHRDTDALLKDIDGDDPSPQANGNMIFVKPQADLTKLASAGVTATWTRTDSAPQPLPGPGRCSVSGGTCEIVSESYDDIEMNATGGGTLTLRDRMMPGWTAEVDGKPAMIPEGTWRTVNLQTPGSHRVVMRYIPPGLKLGIWLLGLGVLAALCTASLLRRLIG